MTQSNSLHSDCRIPIVLAVTGHRDCLDAPHIQARLQLHLTHLKREYPNSSFIALSPLAEGGDRLFAQAALHAKIPLVVPLPLPQADYETDFPDTVDEFRSLLSQAQTVFTLASPLADASSHANARDLHYA